MRVFIAQIDWFLIFPNLFCEFAIAPTNHSDFLSEINNQHVRRKCPWCRPFKHYSPLEWAAPDLQRHPHLSLAHSRAVYCF